MPTESRLVCTPMESRLKSETAGWGWWWHVTASAPLTGIGGDGDGGRGGRGTLSARDCSVHDIQCSISINDRSTGIAEDGWLPGSTWLFASFVGSELGA